MVSVRLVLFSVLFFMYDHVIKIIAARQGKDGGYLALYNALSMLAYSIQSENLH